MPPTCVRFSLGNLPILVCSPPPVPALSHSSSLALFPNGLPYQFPINSPQSSQECSFMGEKLTDCRLYYWLQTSSASTRSNRAFAIPFLLNLIRYRPTPPLHFNHNKPNGSSSRRSSPPPWATSPSLPTLLHSFLS